MAAASPPRSSNGSSTLSREQAQQLLSSHNLPGSFRTQPSALGEVHLEDSLGQLRTALSSSACLLQLALTTAISVGAHIIIGWGVLTNWADHEPVQICLFNWAHPAGYSGAPTSIAQSLPFDAFFTALISCLISMKRMGEVQRGFLPHVPSTALRVGPLFMLFPRRGTSVYPRLSTVVSVTFVWTVFWSALALVTLSIVYAAQGSNAMCTQGWNYIAARTAWGTVEAWLVSAGSFVLWCSLADDVTSRSPAERARLRREADDEDARLAAGFFGWFHVSLVIVAFVALGFGGDGAVEHAAPDRDGLGEGVREPLATARRVDDDDLSLRPSGKGGLQVETGEREAPSATVAVGGLEVAMARSEGRRHVPRATAQVAKH
jgi:hypothetical protein